MTAPAWMTTEQAAAHDRGIAAAEQACADVEHRAPVQPEFDPTYRPQVRTRSHADPYKLPKRDPMAPWWERFAGVACSCPVGCTDKTWGDGGNCDSRCTPCREMAGARYVRKPKSNRGGQVNTTIESEAA
jgi:hypothetical protein